MESINEIICDINNSSRTLYILCGLPYSGKTYLSGEIIKKTTAAYISIDEIFKELEFDWDKNKLPNKEEWDKIFNISYQKSQAALKKNLNVLYDSTNHTKESRDSLRKISQEVNASAKVIYIDVPIEIIWKRWEENNIKNNRPVISKQLVEMTIKSLEIPTEKENFFIIKN